MNIEQKELLAAEVQKNPVFIWQVMRQLQESTAGGSGVGANRQKFSHRGFVTISPII